MAIQLANLDLGTNGAVRHVDTAERDVLLQCGTAGAAGDDAHLRAADMHAVAMADGVVGMDIEARRTLWQAIRHLVAEGNSVVLTTHYLEEAEALADRVCVMVRGKVISEGSVEALRARIALKRVWCSTSLALAEVVAWPEVAEARIDGDRLCLSTEHVELLVRRLLAQDATLSALEVRAAGLAEAFTELTREDNLALQEAA